ncbi:fused MFS/spermidine synthase, partial [Candidatus Roizmanbacteria bacterium]|nr:fused MFS/spermidine synthase [Candidatus Roizmanbacteria bacterium]
STLYQTQSPVNGLISVIEQFGKRELVVGGLQQSGDLVELIWKSALQHIQNTKYKVRNILILGLGGGSAVKVINRYFPNAIIIGVEIDPVIIDVGKKYFQLGKYKNLIIIQTDAFEYVKNENDLNHFNRFDLIVVDLYVGEEIPKKLKSDPFLNNLKRVLAKDGRVMINHLRGKGREKELASFTKHLNRVFPSVTNVRPLVNQVFICQQRHQ